MTVVHVPAHVPACSRLDSAPVGAQDLATDLRASAVAVKNVRAWTVSVAAPDWAGDTARAHDHAATRLAGRLDAAAAALDIAVTAVDRFGDRLAHLFARRAELTAQRHELNHAIDELAAAVLAASDDDRLAELERRAARLTTRAVALRERIEAWNDDERDAERDLLAALGAADSVREGASAAADAGRPDVAALAATLTALAGRPAALAAWWRRLGRAERAALTTEHPGLVGAAGGLPVGDRDEANRAVLARDLDYYPERDDDAQLGRPERDILSNASAVQDALDEHRHLLDAANGTHLAELMAYAPHLHSGDGGVAVSFGDPDTAAHVSVNVPGLTTETSSLSGNLAKMLDLHEAAVDEGRGSVATVYWADYDAPSGNPLNPFDALGQADFDGVALTAKAEAGGERLSAFVDGVRASDEGPRAHLTSIGHSYGSTTVGHALLAGLPVDDVVLAGSPGVPAASAATLTAADVWVGSKDHDPVSLLGRGDRGGIGALGHDPAAAGFGAHRFETGDGALRAEELLANHTSYYAGSSLENVAHVVSGADEEVTPQPARGADGGRHLTLPELLVASSASSAGHALAEAGTWLWAHSRFGKLP
ncbi:alpha/beta hydrolase [Nocardioides sp. R1-1]|uniref:alpha/beta hydrolase n=1 Tax=Nocardioides sp. R1-1 TaxID=3383502 RepID=UPI0038CFAD00